ncbi:unnamed protein product [Acanthoscelides obtectus]|uniref:Uncharacterized protein n=1 Tax=Acanthoscelides obtectus TaxID=200917 RepID=A0A9P0L9F9_ACAOB|nr:unnamed protein product [Acanthoscelides obtectus]CAK1624863.1 hypothetical protein AOBTE_LOCUS2803 [Acanthoscelides obtectus]
MPGKILDNQLLVIARRCEREHRTRRDKSQSRKVQHQGSHMVILRLQLRPGWVQDLSTGRTIRSVGQKISNHPKYFFKNGSFSRLTFSRFLFPFFLKDTKHSSPSYLKFFSPLTREHPEAMQHGGHQRIGPPLCSLAFISYVLLAYC